MDNEIHYMTTNNTDIMMQFSVEVSRTSQTLHSNRIIANRLGVNITMFE